MTITNLLNLSIMKKSTLTIFILVLLNGLLSGQTKVIIEKKNGESSTFLKPAFSCDSDLGARIYEISSTSTLRFFVEGYSNNTMEIPYGSINYIEITYLDKFKDNSGPLFYCNLVTKSSKKYSGGFDYGYCDFVGYDSDNIKNKFNLQTVKKISFIFN